MYTTLDCDFHENSYYYHHLRCQGEKQTTYDLSWLTVHTDSKEQVGNTPEIGFETPVQHLSLPKSLFPLSSDPSMEVNQTTTNPSNCDENCPIIEIQENEEATKTIPETVEELTEHKLPPRSTRGILPKRYDPEYES